MRSAETANPTQLRRRCRLHAREHFFDESGSEPLGWAIYTLSDPRDLRAVRYVGQTTAPRRRFLQHLNHARLWLPHELPWWIKQLELRPLYTWMRKLYGDGSRLPVMIVSAWVTSSVDARTAERAQIFECLAQRHQLLNVEAEILGDQMALL